jgi:hypothetical protein
MKGRESTLFFTLFFFFFSSVNLESACACAIATSALVLSYLSFKTQEHCMVSICYSCSTKTKIMYNRPDCVGEAQGWVGAFAKEVPPPPPQCKFIHLSLILTKVGLTSLRIVWEKITIYLKIISRD